MPRRLRDSTKSACYSAEHEFQSLIPAKLDGIDEVEALVEQVSQVFDIPYVIINKTWAKKIAYAKYREFSININFSQDWQKTVLHEIAHLIHYHRNRDSATIVAHGSDFAYLMVQLVSLWYSEEHGAMLEKLYLEHNIQPTIVMYKLERSFKEK